MNGDGDAALRASLAEHPDAVVVAISANGVVEMPASVELLDHRVFVGASALELLVPEDQVLVMEIWARAQTEPVVEVDVHLLSDPDHLATLHLFDVRASHGAHIVVLEGQDMDAVRRSVDARAALRRHIAHLKRDAIATILEADDATTSLLGWTNDQLVGRATTDFVHPEDVASALENWLQMRSSGEVRRTRVRMRHAHGQYVWVEIVNHPHFDPPEGAYVISELVDISVEMAQLETLRNREQLLARLAEALPIGICHLRADHEVVYSNEPLVALLGEIDSIETMLHAVAPRDHAYLSAALEHAFEGRPGYVEVGVTSGPEERRCELTLRAIINDDGDVDGVIVCAADVTDRSRMRAELEHRATHDALTGCLNRAAAGTEIDRLLRDRREVVVAYIDLDRFKSINDEFGHAAGDEALRVAARRLHAATRPGDLVGRLGGDEFVVICTSDGTLDAATLAHRLTAAINGVVTFARQRIPLWASVGAALSSADDIDFEAVLHRADAAMYLAKRRTMRQADGKVARVRSIGGADAAPPGIA